MIRFNCSKCDKKIGVPEEYSGKLVKCPRCKQPTRVPELELEPVDEQVADSIWTDDLLGITETTEPTSTADYTPQSSAGTPYSVASPQADMNVPAGPPQIFPAGGHQVAVETSGFKNPTILTRSVQVLLVAFLITAGIMLWSNWKERTLLKEFESGKISPIQFVVDAAGNDDRQQKIAIGLLIALAVSGIPFLIWVYRANCNARMLGAHDMEYSPGWSVGWFFVPIANLWKPYNVMKEIAAVSKNPVAFGSEKEEPIVVFWWLLWIVGNILGQTSNRLARRAEEPSEFLTANLAAIGSNVLVILAAAVGIALVQKIFSLQMAHVTKRY